ncbi:MAG: tRNA (guanosine(37)-N1)-methyltransferase TrmD [Gammaproteobacteria bacterium]
MLQLGVVTLFPEMLHALTGYGISGRAVERGLVQLRLWNPRKFTRDKHRSVDDRPYGGGPGMVMMYEPLRDAIRAAAAWLGDDAWVVAMTPQGRRLEQTYLAELVARDKLILVAGRYEGMDERLLEAEVDKECSIGDYVISGGELAAMVLIDALVRLLPGSLGHQDSAREDSFYRGLLDYPHYTRPEDIDGRAVPPVLLSGNHEAIRRWRLKQALGRTWLRRPDLLETRPLRTEERELLDEFVTDRPAESGASGGGSFKGS